MLETRTLKFYKKLFYPSNLYDSNLIIFAVLKYTGVCIVPKPESSTNIYLWSVFVLTIIVYYIFGLYDYLISDVFIQFDNVSDKVEYAGQFAQLSIGFVLTINIQLWFLYLLKKINKFYYKLHNLDLKLYSDDITLLYRSFFKQQLVYFVFGLFNILSLFIFFAIRNVQFLGHIRGHILNSLYCLPYLHINSFIYLYISILYQLYQRFNYINQKLKTNYVTVIKNGNTNVLHNPQTLQHFYTKVNLYLNIHNELSDLMENININFGVLIYVCLILDFVWVIIDSYSVITTLLFAKDIKAEATFMSFLIWWQTYIQIGMLILPLMAETCIIKVLVLHNIY